MSSFEIKKILVPVDFSGTGEKVLEQAALMAKKTKAEITLLTVLEGPLGNTGPDYFAMSVYNSAQYEKMITEWAKKHLEGFKKSLLKKGAGKVSYIIEKGTPYKKILAVAKRVKPNIIIMGTHGISGFREFAVGSNTFRVVSEATCPVLSIQKHDVKAGFKHILLPFRDKPHSRESVDYAISIAQIYGATIHVLGISYDTSDSGVKKLELEAEQIKRIVEKQKVKCTIEVIKGKYLAKIIFAHAKKKKADLIVSMADLDKGGISEYIIGPVIQQIVNHSRTPVLSIHPVINPNAIEGAPVTEVDWTF